MSITDDKTPIIIDRIVKIGAAYQKMFKTKFGLIKISAKPTILVKFYKFHFFSRGGVDFTPPPPSPHVGLEYEQAAPANKVN